MIVTTAPVGNEQVHVVTQSPTDREYQYGNRHAFLQQAFGLHPEELDAIWWAHNATAR